MNLYPTSRKALYTFFAAIPLAFLGCASTNDNEAPVASGSPEYVVFIGSPSAVTLSEYPCSHYLLELTPGIEEVCLDRIFVLRYAVDVPLHGVDGGEEIEFLGSYHSWGMPSYTQIEPALVRLKKSGSYTFMQSIDPVEKRNDVWAMCTSEDAESDDYLCKEWQDVDRVVRDWVVSQK